MITDSTSTSWGKQSISRLHHQLLKASGIRINHFIFLLNAHHIEPLSSLSPQVFDVGKDGETRRREGF
jgi:hypothetical protein